MARALRSIQWALTYGEAAKRFFGSGTISGGGDYLGYHRYCDPGLAAFQDVNSSCP